MRLQRRTQAADAGLVGETPESTPCTTAGLFADYELRGIPGLSFSAWAFYSARRSINNYDQAWIGSYTLFSGGSRYRAHLKGKEVTVQLNIESLGNKHYWSAAGANQLTVGLGRTAMTSSTIDF